MLKCSSNPCIALPCEKVAAHGLVDKIDIGALVHQCSSTSTCNLMLHSGSYVPTMLLGQVDIDAGKVRLLDPINDS